jgi:hypothetical protein
MNKTNQSNNNTLSKPALYAILVISSIFVIGSGVFASNVEAQNMTGGNATGNATGTELMGSTVNTTNATSSPEASMGISGVTELSEANMTVGNQSDPALQ